MNPLRSKQLIHFLWIYAVLTWIVLCRELRGFCAIFWPKFASVLSFYALPSLILVLNLFCCDLRCFFSLNWFCHNLCAFVWRKIDKYEVWLTLKQNKIKLSRKESLVCSPARHYSIWSHHASYLSFHLHRHSVRSVTNMRYDLTFGINWDSADWCFSDDWASVLHQVSIMTPMYKCSKNFKQFYCRLNILYFEHLNMWELFYQGNLS